MTLTDLLIAGGVAGAVFKILGEIIQFALGRWGKKKDKKDVLKGAMKLIMLDRILYLGRAYIRACKVDADDRRRLCEMHKVYHDLGGNGDADNIMAAVNELQLK
jgi:hypothetical protein